ncbi:acid-sensing ion channel 1A-like [Asterias amurensis]|uniref:acid-sensing ion channel 1A-like n=1 Tax=Asterias amurensis TaxID=7602 RepID=UPI003AB7F9C9
MGTNDADQRLSMANLLATVMQNCGAHGLPNIARSASYHRRIVWALLFVSSLVFFVVNTMSMFSTFRSYEVAVNVELEYEREVKFPAVTLCNLNRITLHGMYMFEELRAFFKYYHHTTSIESTEEVVDFSLTDHYYDISLAALNIVAKMPYEERFSTGHNLTSMLLTCTFEGYTCRPTNFTQFYNAIYGNCYTFNFFSENVKKVSRAGPLYGLTMELFIERDEYLSSLQQSAGLRVMVGSQNQMPFPEDEGITVSPGQETFIAVKKVKLDRKKAPFITNCTTTHSTIFSDIFNVSYSKQACEKSCLAGFVLKSCGCADQRYGYNISQPPCLSTNITQELCNTGVVNDYISGALTCDCSLPCKEELYELTVSNAQWPVQAHVETVVSALRQLPDFDEVNLPRDFVEKNVVKFNVYLGSQLHEHISEIPAYDFTRFLSDIGGQVGLCMGVSILTLFEFVEFIFDLVKIAILRVKGKKKVTSSEVNVKPLDATNSTGGQTLSIYTHM